MPGKGEKVLVTGASGFVGAHVVDVLLKNGYQVRATTRSQQKVDALTSRFPQHKDNLEVIVVDELSKPESLKGILTGLTGIFHVASPLTFTVKSNLDDLIKPAVENTIALLTEASKIPSIRRFVYTGSVASMLNYSFHHDHVYAEADYNPITLEQAVSGDGFTGYIGSKVLAENAAFDFIKTSKPHFDLVSLLPTMVYGPIINGNSVADLGDTGKLFHQCVSGQKAPEPFPYDWCVDVRDLAQAHLLAFEKPIASNQRYFISQGNYSWQAVADYAHKYFAGKVKTQVGTPGNYPAPNLHGDNTKSTKELGLTYRPIEQTYHDIIAQHIEFEA